MYGSRRGLGPSPENFRDGCPWAGRGEGSPSVDSAGTMHCLHYFREYSRREARILQAGANAGTLHHRNPAACQDDSWNAQYLTEPPPRYRRRRDRPEPWDQPPEPATFPNREYAKAPPFHIQYGHAPTARAAESESAAYKQAWSEVGSWTSDRDVTGI